MRAVAHASRAGAAAESREAVRPPPAHPPVDGLNRASLTIVAVASLILSVNQTAQSLVSRPFLEWLEHFASALWVNFLVGVAILLTAVWTRKRYPHPGRAQYARVSMAVLGTVVFVALALEVNFPAGIVVMLAIVWARHYPGRVRYAGALLAVGLAAFLGIVALEPDLTPPLPYDAAWGLFAPVARVASTVAQYAFVAMVVTGAWLYTCTDADHAAAIAQCAVDSARMDEQAAEARLQMLEAQIEPHFLFNTLAHVKRLYETDRATGARMLRNLEAYLAVALPQMRASDSTLGRELDHATAYLDIQRIRMGRRLAYAIDVDDRLRDARLPPLMLLTLVENAIKHGLAPIPAGGRVDIRARVETQRLRLEVADTGGGFTKSGGKGTGLANIRARLAAHFGQDATLGLAINSPSGVVATITLPHLPVRADADGP